MQPVIMLWKRVKKHEILLYMYGTSKAPARITIKNHTDIDRLATMYRNADLNTRKIFCKHKDDLKKLQYYYDVWIATERNCGTLDNIQQRGADYHVDHIVPISYGYNMKIPAGLIGNRMNLNVKHRDENMCKGARLTEQAKEIVVRWGYEVVDVTPFGTKAKAII